MVLARLAGAFARLAGAAIVPDCVGCRVPMSLWREDAVTALVVEQTYACGRCGRHVTRVQPWAIPD